MDLQRLKQLIKEDKLVKFYQCKEWRTLRLKALERDNYECQECKKQGKVTTSKDTKLEVHHIKEVKQYPEFALVLSNLKTVCVDCHNKEHRKLDKYIKQNRFWSDERW